MEGGETDRSARLLDFLRQRLGSSALTYAVPPVELQGGFESLIYSFTLGGAPPEFEGPLVLRVFRRLEDPERARREALIHNTVAEHGFPAPRILIAVTGAEEIGAPFLIMPRVPGATMLAQFEGLGRGRPSGELIRLVISMPRILRRTISQLARTQARLHRLPGDLLLRAFEREGLNVGAITFDGKLRAMFDKTGSGPLSDLRPAVAWLIDNRPAEPDALVICHGDFQPFNVMVKDGEVTGVIDWVNATVAEPALRCRLHGRELPDRAGADPIDSSPACVRLDSERAGGLTSGRIGGSHRCRRRESGITRRCGASRSWYGWARGLSVGDSQEREHINRPRVYGG